LEWLFKCETKGRERGERGPIILIRVNLEMEGRYGLSLVGRPPEAKKREKKDRGGGIGWSREKCKPQGRAKATGGGGRQTGKDIFNLPTAGKGGNRGGE